MPTKLKCELHCHSKFSSCSNLKLETILEKCQEQGIRVIAITDHNTIQGALGLLRLKPAELQVIIGEEIMTSEGELLAYFLKQEVPSLLSPEETIYLIKGQGGVVGVSHPFDKIRRSVLRQEALLRLKSQLDFIEIFNSRCLLPTWNKKASSFAKQEKILGLVGSDAHFVEEIGRSLTLLKDVSTPKTFMDSLSSAEFKTAYSPLSVFKSKLLKTVKSY